MKLALHGSTVEADDAARVPSNGPTAAGSPAPSSPVGPVFGRPREPLGNRFVYAVLSPRARGLTLGVNMNPDQRCNFDCVYCEVNRTAPAREPALDVPTMLTELEQTLALVHSGGLHTRPSYQRVPPELLALRQVTLSGDGEPTLCPNFAEAVEAVVHLRACRRFPFFKLVLITNATGLARAEVATALELFTQQDEVWAKLDGGTQAHMNRVNRPDCQLDLILENILQLARHRPVVIQSLFPSIRGAGPDALELEAYAQRLRDLSSAGAQIPLVQIYSASRPTAHPDCGHLPLRTLSQIAQRVREVSGLNAEVF